MLQAQQAAREAAGVGGRPVSMPTQPFQSGIPTLTSAQFAALVGGQTEPQTADPALGPASDPQTEAQSAVQPSPQAVPAATLAATAVPTTATLRLSGLASKRTDVPDSQAGNAGGVSADAAAGTKTADDGGDADAPVITRTGEPRLVTASAEQTADDKTTAAQDAPKSTQEPPVDPNVVHLKDAPDRETQRNLMAQHKRWVVDETPGARQLFFGPDGEFGWDDFLDVINPLQHIPIVAQIYRAVTGDESYGAADLIGGLPFGPLGGIGMVGAVADLAVKDTTGHDVAGNLEAMVFGPDRKTPPGDVTGDTAAASAADGAHLDLQTASAEAPGSKLESARLMHDQCRA
jgi:hypothetical protein